MVRGCHDEAPERRPGRHIRAVSYTIHEADPTSVEWSVFDKTGIG